MTEQKEVILSKEYLQKLQDELEYLKTKRRPEIAEKIKEARSFGDLSENADYDEAKNELLTKYDISFAERRKFWDEIKNFATKENRKRNEGTNAETRSFYGQCYRLSQYDQDIVEKLSWRQWQDILDRVGNREDERIFEWIRHKSEKIREDDWREFEKGLHLYLKKKDTSVFTDKELFEIYESILEMAKYWRISFGQFSKDFPNSAKIRSKARRSKKYQAECFRIKKELRKEFDEEIFSQAFENAMR